MRRSALLALLFLVLLAGCRIGDPISFFAEDKAIEQAFAMLKERMGTSKVRALSVTITPGEVALRAHGRLLTCSTASGPAFEGAHIKDGMRAAVRKAVLAQRELAVEEERLARAAIEAAGGEVTELTPDARRAFACAIQPLYEEARQKFGHAPFEMIGKA